MQRVVLVFAALLVLAGAIGWGQFGQAHYRVLETLVVAPGDPPPTALERLGPAALCCGATAAGIFLLCAGLALRDPQRRLAPHGCGLFIAAAVLLAAGALAWVWTIGQARASFNVIAMSSVSPKPEEVLAALDALTTGATAAGVLLAAGGSLVLVAALAGFVDAAGDSASPSRVPSVLASVAGGGACLVCLVNFLAWRHAAALAATLAGPNVVKPSELAAHLSGVLTCGLLAGLGMCLVCGALGLAALVANRPAGAAISTGAV